MVKIKGKLLKENHQQLLILWLMI